MAQLVNHKLTSGTSNIVQIINIQQILQIKTTYQKHNMNTIGLKKLSGVLKEMCQVITLQIHKMDGARNIKRIHYQEHFTTMQLNTHWMLRMLLKMG